jgi:hypothetical protein
VIGNGAEWIWNLVALHFSDGIQIFDLYHARQHLWEVARKLYPNDEVKQKNWMRSTRSVFWIAGKSKNWLARSGRSNPTTPN